MLLIVQVRLDIRERLRRIFELHVQGPEVLEALRPTGGVWRWKWQKVLSRNL